MPLLQLTAAQSHKVPMHPIGSDRSRFAKTAAVFSQSTQSLTRRDNVVSPCHFRDFNNFGGDEGLVGWLVVDLTNISLCVIQFHNIRKYGKHELN